MQTTTLYQQHRATGLQAVAALALARKGVPANGPLHAYRVALVAAGLVPFARLFALAGGANGSKYGFARAARTAWRLGYQRARLAENGRLEK